MITGHLAVMQDVQINELGPDRFFLTFTLGGVEFMPTHLRLESREQVIEWAASIGLHGFK